MIANEIITNQRPNEVDGNSYNPLAMSKYRTAWCTFKDMHTIPEHLVFYVTSWL